MRGPRIVLGIFATVLVASGIVLPLRAPAAHAASCGPDYEFLSARGSGESADDYLWMGTEGHSLFLQAQTDVEAMGETMTGVGVHYPAISVAGLEGVAIAAGDRTAYDDSESQGVSEVEDDLAQMHDNCSATKFILFGYSQGAQAVGDAIEDLKAVNDPVTESIAGVVLYGDPKFSPTDTQSDRGTFDANHSGLFGPRAVKWSDVIDAPVYSYCLRGDFVCNPERDYKTSAGVDRYSVDLDYLGQSATAVGHADSIFWIHSNYPATDVPSEASGAIAELLNSQTGSASPSPLDVVFVVDTTQSTDDAESDFSLSDDQQEASDLMAEAAAESSDVEAAVVSFSGASSPSPTTVDVPFTSTASWIESGMQALVPSGGTSDANDNDPAGAGLSGVNAALGLQWRPGSRHLIVLMSSTVLQASGPNGAEAGPEEGSGLTTDEVAGRAIQQNTVIVSAVGTTDMSVGGWQETLAQDTQGLYQWGQADGALAVSLMQEQYETPYVSLAGPLAADTTEPYVYSAMGSTVPDPDSTISSYGWSVTKLGGVSADAAASSPSAVQKLSAKAARSKSASYELAKALAPRFDGMKRVSSKQLKASSPGSSRASSAVVDSLPSGGDSTLADSEFEAQFASPGTYRVKVGVQTSGGYSSGVLMDVFVADIPDISPEIDHAAESLADNLITYTITPSGADDPTGTVYTATDATGSEVGSWVLAPAGGLNSFEIADADRFATAPVVSRWNEAGSTPADAFVIDNFDRSTASGLGTADVGGPWTTTSGPASAATTTGAGAQLTASAGQTVIAMSGNSTSANSLVDAEVQLLQLPVGGSAFFAVVGRKAGSSTYRGVAVVAPSGAVSLAFENQAGTHIGSDVSTGLSLSAGQLLHVEMLTTGTSPTTLDEKVWIDGATPPDSWQMMATDNSAGLQVPGSVGVGAYLGSGATSSPLAFQFDQFIASGASAANAAPVPTFDATENGYVAKFDATGSTGNDGINSYAWNFGDGATGSGATPSHAYAAAGSYPVSLTVTDGYGASATISKTVVTTGPFVVDHFGRTVTGSLGTADTGGAWAAGSSPSDFADDGSTANVTISPGQTASSFLTSVATGPADVTATMSVSALPAGGGVDGTIYGRRVGAGQSYDARVRVSPSGAVTVKLEYAATGALLASATVSGLTVTPSTTLGVRLDVSGNSPTLLSARVWDASQPEPSAWTVTATDSTAVMQAPGAIGIGAYMDSSATTSVDVKFDDLTADLVPSA